jgi:hypothetical protein
MSSIRAARASLTAATFILVLCALALPAACLASAPHHSEADDGGGGEPGDICRRGYTSYYWTLDDRFSGSESYMVYCDPTGCSDCGGGWKPISVTMYLYWETKNSCALTVQAEIRRAESSVSAEPEPGDLIAMSEPTVVGPFSPAGLWAVTVALPRDCPEVDGACFATLKFLDTCDERPAVVATPSACEESTTWVDRGSGWMDLARCDYPGNPSLHATFECQLPPEEEVDWSTIKSRFAD